jgi:hypothetical protein
MLFKPLTRCFTQLVCDPPELMSALLESVGHARKILRSRRPSPDRPTAEHIVLQAGIIGKLPHGERPVAEHALNKPNDVFALQPAPPSGNSRSQFRVDTAATGHYIVSTG